MGTVTRHSARLRQLEAKLLPKQERPPVVVLWVMFDGDVPDWATEALRPHLPPGDVIVMWHRAPSTGELGAEVRGRWYIVTPDGCQPTDPPIELAPNPFTLELDNPNGAGPMPVTPRLAADMLRAAEEDGTLPD